MCKKVTFYEVYLNCRRGMLELDIIFIKFLEQKYIFLSDDLKKQFKFLLEQSDQDLYMWLIKDMPVDNLSILDIVNDIKKFIQNLVFI